MIIEVTVVLMTCPSLTMNVDIINAPHNQEMREIETSFMLSNLVREVGWTGFSRLNRIYKINPVNPVSNLVHPV